MYIFYVNVNVKLIIHVSQIIHLLSFFSNLRAATCSNAVSPTHFLFARYPHPKSLPSGKGLTVALAGLKAVFRKCETYINHS